MFLTRFDTVPAFNPEYEKIKNLVYLFGPNWKLLYPGKNWRFLTFFFIKYKVRLYRLTFFIGVIFNCHSENILAYSQLHCNISSKASLSLYMSIKNQIGSFVSSDIFNLVAEENSFVIQFNKSFENTGKYFLELFLDGNNISTISVQVYGCIKRILINNKKLIINFLNSNFNQVIFYYKVIDVNMTCTPANAYFGETVQCELNVTYISQVSLSFYFFSYHESIQLREYLKL